jgi:hypothetical protein
LYASFNALIWEAQMDLQQAFNVLEHKFEDGTGVVLSTSIRREEWLPIRAELVEALKPAHNKPMPGEAPQIAGCVGCVNWPKGEVIPCIDCVHNKCLRIDRRKPATSA